MIEKPDRIKAEAPTNARRNAKNLNIFDWIILTISMINFVPYINIDRINLE